jgi:aspartyl-tRNA(Asn)/glutamyl-tRNA(Gln) amidotransferase subunit A
MSGSTFKGRPLTELGVCEAADAIATAELSPVELTAAVLDRIEAEAEGLNAFRTIMVGEATAAAAEAERAVKRGDALGRLHGIPIALKDNIGVRDVAMTASTGFLRDNIADHDAPVVTRLREAGAVIVGKLHMAEWAIGATTQNIHFGVGRNAWDPERTPGGSSGGSGAAVAADLVPVALGTDTGGSVRIPAALNGVTGLRPTSGRVSNRGTIPVAWSFDTVGPLARRAEDVARALEVIEGYDAEDPASADRRGGGYEAAIAEGGAGLRIGVLGGEFRKGLPAETATLLDRAAAEMERLGARVEPVELHGLEPAIELVADLLLAEAASFHAERLAEQPDGFAPDVVARLRRGAGISGPEYGRGRQEQRRWQRQVLQALEGHDLLLAPAAPISAPLIAECDPLETTGVLARFISIFALSRTPGLVAPVGFSSEGLPLGMQLIGRPFEEGVLLRAAHAYQQETDWHLRRPGPRSPRPTS